MLRTLLEVILTNFRSKIAIFFHIFFLHTSRRILKKIEMRLLAWRQKLVEKHQIFAQNLLKPPRVVSTRSINIFSIYWNKISKTQKKTFCDPDTPSCHFEQFLVKNRDFFRIFGIFCRNPKKNALGLPGSSESKFSPSFGKMFQKQRKWFFLSSDILGVIFADFGEISQNLKKNAIFEKKNFHARLKNFWEWPIQIFFVFSFTLIIKNKIMIHACQIHA